MSKVRIRKVQTILQLGIFIICFKTAFSQSAILPYSDMADNILTFAAVACLTASILHEKYTIKRLLLYGAITLISLISVMQTKNFGLLTTVIVCLAIRKSDINEILESVFKYQLFFLVAHTCIAIVLFLLEKTSLVMMISGVGRYTFGFSHPNLFSIYLFNLIILWAWINYQKIQMDHIAVILAISLVAYYLTKTRTSILTTIAFCIILLITKSKYSLKSIFNPIAKFIVPACAAGTLWCVSAYMSGNRIAMMINSLLSNRIKLGAYAVSHYGFSFWGQDISQYKVVWDPIWGLTGITFDNIYTFLAVNQGFIWIVVFSVLFYKLARIGNLQINIFIIIWALYGVTEVHGLNGFKCFPVFLLVLLFRNDKPAAKRKGFVKI